MPPPRGGLPLWAKLVIGALAALITLIVLRPLVFPAYHIPSLSMAPTLTEGDRVLVNRFSTDPSRGDIVVFGGEIASTRGSGADLLKRTIAVAGETIEFRDGEVYVDGLLLTEPYLAQQASTVARAFEIPNCVGDLRPNRCEVPVGHIFVMGDNRAGSQDSRTYGPVPVDSLVGTVFLRVLPLSEFGGL